MPHVCRFLIGSIPYVGILFSLIFGVVLSEASWSLDPWEYHTSAHGQTSCQDCHEGYEDRLVHPDPDQVNKKPAAFSIDEGCLSCHDNIPEDLESGLHGATKISEPFEYGDCLGCHGPHDEPLLEAIKDRFDLDKPRNEQCGACHDKEPELPPLTLEDEICMGCHGLSEPDDPERQNKIESLCFFCHGRTASRTQQMGRLMAPLIDEERYHQTSHALNACTDCHFQAARFQHEDQRRIECRECHLPHAEKVARAAHLEVACEACHLQGITPIRIPESGLVQWERDPTSGRPQNVHEMFPTKEEAACPRCHFKGNQVGAASMLLPAKSLICMPCHPATLSVSDATTLLALIVFCGGLVILISIWFSGALIEKRNQGPHEKKSEGLGNAADPFFSGRIFSLIKAILFEVLLQRSLFKRSEVRWFIHALIFFPLLCRLFWGLSALATSLLQPEWSIPWVMLDKNHATTAFLFDVTGVLMLLGVVLTFIRGTLKRSGQPPGLPRQDLLALGLLAGIVLIGFMLEAVRIAMAGRPDQAAYAFVGYGVSGMFSNTPGLNEVYGTIWYVHAILTGAFVAYLPFSRLSHIILAPMVLMMDGVWRHEKH